MTNTTDSTGGLLGLSSDTGAGDLATAFGDLLQGGSSSNLDPNTVFDPTMFGGGGTFSPTGVQSDTPISAPQISAAQQDPSGQILDKEDSSGLVDRAQKGDRATTPDVQKPLETRGADPDKPPVGPTGQPGQQTQPAQKPDVPATLASATGAQPTQPGSVNKPVSPLQQLAKNLLKPTAQQGDQAATPDAAAPAAAPAAAAAQQAVAAAPSRPTAQPAAAPAAAPQPQPPLGGGAAPGGMPPGLMKALLSLLGVPTGGLGGMAQQAMQGAGMPGVPGAPGGGGPAATHRLGPYRRARAFARGNEPPDSSDDPSYRVAPPGTTGEVTAPTADQVKATRMAGTDTPPTEGFSEYLQNERAHFGDELSKSDRTKWETLAMIHMENGGDPAAVAESLLNRANYARTSVSNMLHSGFYGPINRGALGRTVRMLQRNPSEAAKMNAGLETALRGSNLLGGATDQGSGNDPNVGHRGGRVIRQGEVYNDWGGGPGGHDGAANYRRNQQRQIRAEQYRATQGASLGDAAFQIAKMGPMRGGATANEFRELEGAKRKRREAEAT